MNLFVLEGKSEGNTAAFVIAAETPKAAKDLLASQSRPGTEDKYNPKEFSCKKIGTADAKRAKVIFVAGH